MKLTEDLLQILACPKCKSDLKYIEDNNQLVCYSCRLVYKIENEIPVLLIEEAKPLEDDEK